MNLRRIRRKFERKVFLVGIVVFDENENHISQFQTNGIVKEITNEGIICLLRKDESIFQIPYDSKTIQIAQKGEYREHSTGEIIINPDFIVTWEIVGASVVDIDEIKSKGFVL